MSKNTRKILNAFLTAVISLAVSSVCYSAENLYSVETPKEAKVQIFQDDYSSRDNEFHQEIVNDVIMEKIDKPVFWWDTNIQNDTNINNGPIMDHFSKMPLHEKAAEINDAVDNMSLIHTVSIRIQDSGLIEKDIVPVYFTFETERSSDLSIIAVLGTSAKTNEDDASIKDSFDWHVLKAEYQGNRECVYFPKQVLEYASGKDSVLSILAVSTSSYEFTEETEKDKPSKSVDNMIRASYQTEHHFIFETAALDERSRTEFKKAYEFLRGKKGSIIEFFPKAVKDQIRMIIPDANIYELELYEAVDTFTVGYQAQFGYLPVDMYFPEKFEEGHWMVAVSGAFNDLANVEWTPLKAELNGDSVRIYFTSEALDKMETREHNILYLLYQPEL